MPGKAPRQKGDRFERLIVELLRAAGLDAKRVPLSGSVRGFNSDVILRIGREELKGECKHRGRSFSRLYAWLATNDFLAIKADGKPPLIIIEAGRLAQILAYPIGRSSIETTTDKAPTDIGHRPQSNLTNRYPLESNTTALNPVRLRTGKPPII